MIYLKIVHHIKIDLLNCNDEQSKLLECVNLLLGRLTQNSELRILFNITMKIYKYSQE